MTVRRALILAPALLLLGPAQLPQHNLPVAAPNDNRIPAGVLRDGVLTVGLEAMATMWYPDGDSLPGMTIEAFAESGKRPSAPGPLLRVPSGTEIRVSVRNSLDRDTITFSVPGNVSAGKDAASLDSIVVPPGTSASSGYAPTGRAITCTGRTPTLRSTRHSTCADSLGARSSSTRQAAASQPETGSSSSWTPLIR